MKIKTKLLKSEVVKVLSATYIAPQWMEADVKAHEQCIEKISAEMKVIDAMLDSGSINMAIYGDYCDQNMGNINIKGFVWRYHGRANPRLSAYGAMVFYNDQVNIYRFDLKGFTDAKNLSDLAAKNIIDNLLE